jgi:hypothetical protein
MIHMTGGIMVDQSVTATTASEEEATSKPLFDPDRLAYLEVGGWRAYYDKNWPKMLRLLVTLTREQFGFTRLRALQGAYYILRASIAWKPVDHDLRIVRRYLRRFYVLAYRYGTPFGFDPKVVADKELRYWIVSRKYSSTPWREESPLIDTMTDLHAALFNITPEAARPSGWGRARSLHVVGSITAGRSMDLERDWELSERYLREGYRSLLAAI